MKCVLWLELWKYAWYYRKIGCFQATLEQEQMKGGWCYLGMGVQVIVSIEWMGLWCVNECKCEVLLGLFCQKSYKGKEGFGVGN